MSKKRRLSRRKKRQHRYSLLRGLSKSPRRRKRRQRRLYRHVRIVRSMQTAQDSSPDSAAARIEMVGITVITAALSRETEMARIRAASVQIVVREAATRAASVAIAVRGLASRAASVAIAVREAASRAVSAQIAMRDLANRAVSADAALDPDRAAAQQLPPLPVRVPDPARQTADAAEPPEDPRAKDSLISIEMITRER